MAGAVLHMKVGMSLAEAQAFACFVVQIVKEALQEMQVLLDRLSALQMMLQQKPVVSGHYTSSPYVSS